MTDRAGTVEPAPLLRSARERYQVLARVGEGSSATVFKVRDLELDEVIALKVLAPAVSGKPAVVERLKREIRIARRVRHPNVARVYDLEEWDGRLCVSMELIEGETLEQRLARGPMAPPDVVAILNALALALESAHELGVIHRDLKPANVVLDPRGRPYVLDFGIAVAPGHEESGARDVIRGSPIYMAPERWRGLPGSPSSDLYSLGVVAYQMLAGAPPFRAESLRVLMSQHLHAPLPPLGELVRDAPPGLAELVRALLAKRPEDRPGSATELLRQLRRVAPRRPAAPRPKSRGRVLVVEDEPAVRHLLAAMLQSRGVEVLEASDGLQGVEKAGAGRPDLIFLDIRMPGLDGVATLRALKTRPEVAARPVVMLSGSSDPEHPDLSRGLGAVAFLNKPVNPDVLDLVLDKYLG